MSHDPLESLLRVRRAAADEARRGLAECLRLESQATKVTAAIKAAIEHEAESAADLAAGDADVEAFATWLCRMRPKQQAAYAAEEEAEAETARARIVLAAAQAAVRAVEVLLEEHAAAAIEDAQRRAQTELDEVALRRRDSGAV